MKQIEVDSLVSMIDELQANYWRDTKKGKIVIVDTSYLLDEDVLPMYSPIVVPFQVMIELDQLKKWIYFKVCHTIQGQLSHDSRSVHCSSPCQICHMSQVGLISSRLNGRITVLILTRLGLALLSLIMR